MNGQPYILYLIMWERNLNGIQLNLLGFSEKKSTRPNLSNPVALSKNMQLLRRQQRIQFYSHIMHVNIYICLKNVGRPSAGYVIVPTDLIRAI